MASASAAPATDYGSRPSWEPVRPRFRPVRLVIAWAVIAVSLLVAAALVPGVSIPGIGAALVVALIVGVLNAVLPPIVAALRLPLTVVVDFLLLLVIDAAILLAAASITDDIKVSSFWTALLASVVASAVSIALDAVFGVDDDETYTFRVIHRIARRSSERVETNVPGVVFLEIDGLAAPVLRRAMRDGNAPNMARWLAEGSHAMAEWETDLSSQTGASQAGILLGSNEDIPAFRWVEKESGRLMTCSNPHDCATIEGRLAKGNGLLVDGGASRGNLLSGESDYAILTVSRTEAEKRANPGYRAFFANGFNVTRTLSLFVWEVVLELVAAGRQRRRHVEPRGHRGGLYPFMRAALCVIVRDLIVYSVLEDVMKGRPAIYATFSSYDEVAHHSGLERQDTLEALRKLDHQFGRIDSARRFAPRPYRIIVLSDHGQTQGATFKQRNGYGLDHLVSEVLSSTSDVTVSVADGDENQTTIGTALDEATGRQKASKQKKTDVPSEGAVVLASGNLGLIYLMSEPRRLMLEEIDKLHPELVPTLRAHPDIGWLLVRSEEFGPVVLGRRGTHYLEDGAVDGEDPLAQFSPNAPRHLHRTDGFTHVADIVVGSFYDPYLEQGCAFEELISFHGGLGGPQTRPFVLAPAELAFPEQPIVGAAGVHDLLAGWRGALQQPNLRVVVTPEVIR